MLNYYYYILNYDLLYLRLSKLGTLLIVALLLLTVESHSQMLREIKKTQEQHKCHSKQRCDKL